MNLRLQYCLVHYKNLFFNTKFLLNKKYKKVFPELSSIFKFLGLVFYNKIFVIVIQYCISIRCFPASANVLYSKIY